VPSLSFGHDPRSLRLGNYVLAVTICFEDTVPQVVARFFPNDGKVGEPDVLINLSNDGWFHGSAELDMHLAIGVFRAVEHRVPLARAVNTGLTALIDGNGELRAALPKESDGVLSVTVPLDNRGSPYSRLGDWLGLSCPADRHHRHSPQIPVAILTRTPEIATLCCLPERRAWGKFGQVGTNRHESPN
jgi:apolipoprotein N-acyltransferase